MPIMKNFSDVVDWQMCTGCGACIHSGSENSPYRIVNTEVGKRPGFHKKQMERIKDLQICPGISVDGELLHQKIYRDEIATKSTDELLIGPYKSIYCGYSADEETRILGSSGGIITSICVYFLENRDVDYIVQTGMDESMPWSNKTVISRERNDIQNCAGSRYVSSSPCDAISYIEEREEKCIFVGRPCDVAAMRAKMNIDHSLKSKIFLLLTFFCAGTPSQIGPEKLISTLKLSLNDVDSVVYRGKGWPGMFQVTTKNGNSKELTYEKSWGYVEKYRPLRCYLCPDGLGELGDITCGDAWDRFETGNSGISYLLCRSDRGQKELLKLINSRILYVTESSPSEIVAAQGLVERRRVLYGRLLARQLFYLPIPEFNGFYLKEIWKRNGFMLKFRTLLGTIRRIFFKKLWHRHNYYF